VKPLGNMNFASLHAIYGAADGAVFASSCENLPNILLEAMASGLPNASSGSGPMPEVLGDAGIYFDPRDPDSIAATLRTLIEDDHLRAELATRGHCQAAQYSWARCASETFRFIRGIAQARTP
jgi:glycosyltransferase involved in cell wall biosynthesis